MAALSSFVFAIGADDPAFVDVTASAGLNYVQHTPWSFGDCLVSANFCQPDRMSGGGAVGDFDADGWDDLFVTRLDDTDLLFRNMGDGTFEDVTQLAGLAIDAHTNGALWADFDLDGDLDLFVSVIGELGNLLYMNQGDGTFTEEAALRGAAVSNGVKHVGFSSAVGDYDGDGYLDLFTTEWASGPFLPPGVSPHAVLLRNRGATAPGYFVDATDEAGIELAEVTNGNDSSLFGFGPAFVDLDRDGHLDLAIAADFETSQLFWNNGDGTFLDGTAAASIGTDKNGMGSTFGDYDGDGDLDWFVTSIFYPGGDVPDDFEPGDNGNRLYRYDGNRQFSDMTDVAGVRDGMWGWGTAFFDYDNDADLDLVMTNGVRFPGQDEEFAVFADDPVRLWENDAGAMTDVAVARGIDDRGDGKGLLTFDYDQDGDLDVLLLNNGEAPALYRNDTKTGHDWLRVRFEGPTPGEGLNAFITVLTFEDAVPQVREHGVATHFLGQSERVSHFGLGPSSPDPVYEVRINWPRSGTVQQFNNVPRRQVLTIEIPTSERVYPRDFSCHAADYLDCNFEISLSELLRVIQLFNSGGYQIASGTEDGFAPGSGDTAGAAHHADYAPSDWDINLSEVLRMVQFYNSEGFARDITGEDGYVPG